jgi:hypothetical protein
MPLRQYDCKIIWNNHIMPILGATMQMLKGRKSEQDQDIMLLP